VQPPPSRYKVVEQGRRLVVIDTWNGDRPVTRQAPEAPARPRTPEQARAALRPAQPRRPAGTATDIPDLAVTTQAWFDSKGPRLVALDPGAQGLALVLLIVAGVLATLMILSWGWPVLIILGFFLAQKSVRAGLRNAVTLWLDTQQRG